MPRENACEFNLVPPAEAARALNVCTETLRRWRNDRQGPAYVKVGGRFFYPRERLTEYVQAHSHLYETA